MANSPSKTISCYTIVDSLVLVFPRGTRARTRIIRTSVVFELKYQAVEARWWRNSIINWYDWSRGTDLALWLDNLQLRCNIRQYCYAHPSRLNRKPKFSEFSPRTTPWVGVLQKQRTSCTLQVPSKRRPRGKGSDLTYQRRYIGHQKMCPFSRQLPKTQPKLHPN